MTAAPGLHPDLVRIRQAVEESDLLARQMAGVDETADLALLHQNLVDFDSLFCASTDRARQAMRDINPLLLLSRPDAILGATWADGFLAGVRYARLNAGEGS